MNSPLALFGDLLSSSSTNTYTHTFVFLLLSFRFSRPIPSWFFCNQNIAATSPANNANATRWQRWWWWSEMGFPVWPCTTCLNPHLHQLACLLASQASEISIQNRYRYSNCFRTITRTALVWWKPGRHWSDFCFRGNHPSIPPSSTPAFSPHHRIVVQRSSRAQRCAKGFEFHYGSQ